MILLGSKFKPGDLNSETRNVDDSEDNNYPTRSFVMKTCKNPKLSIVVPTYNNTSLILRCLKSLEDQNACKGEFEVIVVNDGSEDDTFQALEEYVSQSSLQLRIYHIPHSGPASARNHGVEKARSKWIAFLDADMIAHPQWVKRGLELISQDIPVGGFEGKTEVGNRENVTPFTHQMSNIRGGRYPTCNIILRKKLCNFFNGYKIPFREDTDLAFSILESGFEIVFDRNLLAFHPPLSPNYKRPVKLAMRYYYDGLLARRFPEKYREDVDVHWICGLRIPHLRRKAYSIFALSQLSLLCALLFLAAGSIVSVFAGILHLVCYIVVLIIHLKNVKITNLKLKDTITLLGVTCIVPWILLIQWVRGLYAFRKEPLFSIPVKRERRKTLLMKNTSKRSRLNVKPHVVPNKARKKLLGNNF